MVEPKRAKPWDEPVARIAYLIVPVLFVFGCAVNRGSVPDKAQSGLILEGLGFALAWLMNRRTRLRRRLEYRVTRTVQRAKDTF